LSDSGKKVEQNRDRGKDRREGFRGGRRKNKGRRKREGGGGPQAKITFLSRKGKTETGLNSEKENMKNCEWG